RVGPRRLEMNRRNLRCGRKVVFLGLPKNYKERMDSSDTGLLRVVDLRVFIAALLQLLDPRFGTLAQIIDFSKLNRLGGTRLRACRHQPRRLAVIAEGALEGEPLGGPPIDHSKRTGYNAVATPVAHIRLYVNRPYLRTDDCAGRARFQTSRVCAVLTDVGQKLPAKWFVSTGQLRAHWLLLLEKEHVPPRGGSQSVCVVVRLTVPFETVIGNLVPLLASHFAGFATDAD